MKLPGRDRTVFARVSDVVASIELISVHFPAKAAARFLLSLTVSTCEAVAYQSHLHDGQWSILISSQLNYQIFLHKRVPRYYGVKHSTSRVPSHSGDRGKLP